MPLSGRSSPATVRVRDEAGLIAIGAVDVAPEADEIAPPPPAAVDGLSPADVAHTAGSCLLLSDAFDDFGDVSAARASESKGSELYRPGFTGLLTSMLAVCPFFG